MEIGSRVAYILSEKARCGVVVAIADDVYSVKLDDNTTTLRVGPDRLYQIDYWKTIKREADASKIKQLPDSASCLDIFKRKKPMVFGTAGIRAMWYWANHNVFQGKLTEPTFKLSTSRKNLGMWYYKPRVMEISLRNISFLDVFSVVLHECVHQMNQLEEMRGELDPREAGHGAGFLRWIPIIQEKTGVKISVLCDMTKRDTEVDEVTHESEPKCPPFIFAIANLKMNDYWGFLVDSEEVLESLASRLRQIMMHNRETNGRVYAGTCNLARVRRELQKVPSSNVGSFKIGTPIQPPILQLVKKNYKPIEGFYGPDKD
jgi:hypothetical protein